MSDDAIQDLLSELDGIAAGDKVSHWTIARARGQHEAHRARVAELTSALEGRASEVAQLHDCGQDGACALSPGCVQCSIERSRELLAEVAQLQAKVARLESAIADQVIADGVARGG